MTRLTMDSTIPDRTPARGTAAGWINGFLGMLIFSGSLPATRVAVLDFDPVFLTTARASVAALLAFGMLRLLGSPKPRRADIPALIVVAGGAVVGFPLLTALALRHMTSAHSLVFIGLLPLATATFGVLRGGERPQPAFWFFSVLGSALVAGFALTRSGASSLAGDALMLGAVILCGLSYAEGGRLSRRLGGLPVIAWALVLSLPVMLPVMLCSLPLSWTAIGPQAWVGLGYVTLFSMLIGFVFWYRGLALGGIAAVGQLQLLQPFFGLALAAALLHETVEWSMLAVTAAIVACVAGAKRFAG